MEEQIEEGDAKNPKIYIARKLKRLFPNGCKKILLVHPPNVPKEDWNPSVAIDNRYPVYPPTGLATLSRTLQNHGYAREDIDILDLNLLLQIIFKANPDAFRFEVWQDILKAYIESFKPDLVGTGCMFTIYYRQMKAMAEFIKEKWPKLPIIAGGVHTSDASKLVAEDCKKFDILHLFEGNESFPIMIDFVNGKGSEEDLRQLASMIGNEFVEIRERSEKSDTTMSVIPDYHDLPLDLYSEYGRIGTFYWLFPPKTRMSTVLSNIGCRAQCTFCSVRYFNGKEVFARDFMNVVDEFVMIRDRYGITHVMFLDDDLLYDRMRTLRLFNEMVRRNLGMTWDATNGIIASAVNPENAQAMAESGCIGLSFGVESGSPRILKEVKKPSGVQHMYRCMEYLRPYPKIFTKALLICGFPDETVGEMLQTVELTKNAGFDWGTIQTLNYIPGVEITNHMIEQGKIDKKAMLDGSERPGVGSTGWQIRREAAEGKKAKRFEDLFIIQDCGKVHDSSKIMDYWFLMDYKINYERLLTFDNPLKLDMLRKLFINICDNTHHTNAMGNLFFAVIESKVGTREEARRRLALARKFAGELDYWGVRFDALGLHKIADELEQKIEAMQ